MTYREKLRLPQWQKKRLAILERDDWACCICHRKDASLQVHHLVYANRDPWDYPDEVLQTLCEECHEVRQELTDKIVNALRLALKNIPTERLEVVGNRLAKEAMLEMEGAK